MTERNGREDSEATDDSVEIPVTVEGDEESGPVGDEDSSGAQEVGGEETAEAEGAAEGEGDEPGPEGDESDPASDDEELDDLYLSPEESDVEVVEDSPVEGVDSAETLESGESLEEPSRPELAERVDELEAELEQLRQERDQAIEERDEFEERMLRAAADLENFRKRSEREKEELRKYGAKNLVKDLLETIDNLERAVEHADSGEEESIIEGVEMVLRQIHTTLNNHGIEVFEAEGEEFDPEYHEAIQQIETTDHESGHILEEYQKGYTIHDRLLRPAMVSVAKRVEPGEEDEEGESTGADQTQEVAEEPAEDDGEEGGGEVDDAGEPSDSPDRGAEAEEGAERPEDGEADDAPSA